MAARSRLLIELRESQRLKDPQVEFVVNEENLYEWTAIVAGPAQSPYEGGRWKLRVTCPPTYPLAPPTVTFLTKCFHPNVDFNTGAVCLDVLREGSWTPAWNIHFVCVAIAALLDQPNAESPLNCDAGNLIRSGDIRGFESMARMYTIEYACGDGSTQL